MIYSDIVNGVASNSSSNSAISSVKKNNEAKDASTLDVNDFLQLLVAQMQYQDPLEPKDNTEYIAQMATFTQVEATAQMNNSVEQQMASSLVGKTVIMATDNSTDGFAVGRVDYWETIDGVVYLGINNKLYDIADLDTVMDDQYFAGIMGGANGGTTGSTEGATDKETDKVEGTGETEKA